VGGRWNLLFLVHRFSDHCDLERLSLKSAEGLSLSPSLLRHLDGIFTIQAVPLATDEMTAPPQAVATKVASGGGRGRESVIKVHKKGVRSAERPLHAAPQSKPRV
jgi:hypothetical protein